MEYAKIVVKSKYENRGDLVLRSYVRALAKIDETRLLDENGIAYIYGIIDDEGKFHEAFTNGILDYDAYCLVSLEELFELDLMPDNRKALLKKIMESVLFGKKVDLDFDISTAPELAQDRAIEFDAYDKLLSGINPYQRLTDQDGYNAYNSYDQKIRAIKRMRKLNQMESFDEYELANYENLDQSRGAYVKK